MLLSGHGETRHYALRNAPLTRVALQARGQASATSEGWLADGVGCTPRKKRPRSYSGLRDDGSAANFQETNAITPSVPVSQRPFCSPADVTPLALVQVLRYEKPSALLSAFSITAARPGRCATP